MPHTDTTPVSASGTVSTGFSIRYIKNWAYALSGEVINGDGETNTLLDFTVANNSFIVAEFQIGFAGPRSNDDTRIEILLNEILVASNVYNNNYGDIVRHDFNLLLPGSSNVKCQAVKVSGTADVPVLLWMAGRVYGEE